MKLILLNGSRREKGCTYTALSVVADTLRENGIDTEIIHAVPYKTVVTTVAEKMNTADA
ncbi:NAD(P)H-dependent oxidoreductase, partial [Megasphaera massiliensis]